MIEYFEHGFFKLTEFFNKGDILKIKEQIPEIVKNEKSVTIYEDNSNTVRSIMGYHNANKVLNYYSQEPRILDIVKELLRSKVYISQSKINLKKSKLGKKWDYHRGFTFWHLLDGIPNSDMISVFICLTKQTKKNGAVYVLKGSHLDVDIDLIKQESVIITDKRENDTSSNLSIQIKKHFLKKYKERYEKEYLVGDVGDVFFMHPCLLHASDDNTALESRDLMITVYNSINNLPTKQNRPTYLCERFDETLKL